MTNALRTPLSPQTVPPARHLLRAKDLIDARYTEPLDVPLVARAAHRRPPSTNAASTGKSSTRSGSGSPCLALRSRIVPATKLSKASRLGQVSTMMIPSSALRQRWRRMFSAGISVSSASYLLRSSSGSPRNLHSDACTVRALRSGSARTAGESRAGRSTRTRGCPLRRREPRCRRGSSGRPFRGHPAP